jgi:hypothetical protein
VEVPLAFWEFDSKIFLQQIMIENDSMSFKILLLGDHVETVSDQYMVDLQTIRVGSEPCSPNVSIYLAKRQFDV